MRTLTTTSCVLAATRRFRFAGLLSLALIAMPVQRASAVTIADFQFPGLSPVSADLSTDWNTSSITAGASLSPLNVITVGNPSPGIENLYSDLDLATPAVSLATSISAGNFYSFTVTPTGGALLNFTQLSFDLGSSGSASATAHVLSSVGGFNTGSVIGAFSDSSTSSPAFQSAMIDVSSLSQVDSPIEFRIYLTRPSVGVLTNTIRTDNILLTAEVATVPEPSSLLLLGLGAIGLVRHTRRRRRKA